MKFHSIVFLLSCIILFSCQTKQDDSLVMSDLSEAQDKVSVLAGEKSKEWEVEKYILNGKDIVPHLDNCVSDNLDIYFADHRFESVEGESKCKEDDPFITETGHWHFNEDTTEIEVSTSKDFYILKLLELSPEKFHYLSCNHIDTVEAILKPKGL